MGLVSEAGMPAVADPGSSVVRAAHDLGAQVVPLVGPVSLLLTLAASGLNGRKLCLSGLSTQDASARAQRIRSLFALSQSSGQAQLVIETPYRNPAPVAGAAANTARASAFGRGQWPDFAAGRIIASRSVQTLASPRLDAR